MSTGLVECHPFAPGLPGRAPLLLRLGTGRQRALLVADRKRLNKTTAIGLDKTSFVKLSEHDHADYGTTVADVAHHQIIDILPSQPHPNRRGGLDRQQR